MQNVFESDTYSEIIDRIQKLNPEHKAWPHGDSSHYTSFIWKTNTGTMG